MSFSKCCWTLYVLPPMISFGMFQLQYVLLLQQRQLRRSLTSAIAFIYINIYIYIYIYIYIIVFIKLGSSTASARIIHFVIMSKRRNISFICGVSMILPFTLEIFQILIMCRSTDFVHHFSLRTFQGCN